MQLKLFFLPSKAVAARITETFDFVWPTAAAIWNLRWQVKGLVGAQPGITESALLGRFVEGSGIKGVNLRRACIDASWQSQQEQFGKFLLFEFCAFYETWCELMTDQLSLRASTKKDLQFPAGVGQSGNPTGIANVLSNITINPSPLFANSIHPFLASNRKYSPSHIQELLTCYRYFKELRNSLIHGSSSALAKLAGAENTYSTLTAASIGLTQRPEYIPYSSNQPPTLSLRGVVGFGEVVLKLVTTLDIEFAASVFAERDFKYRWRAAHGVKPYLVAATDVDRRKARIGVLIRKLGLPTPKLTKAFVGWLKSEGLIFY